MNLRTILAASVLAAAAGCADKPVSHHATEQKVFNYDAAVDATVTVFNRHYNQKIDSIAQRGDSKVVTSGYNEKVELTERERWRAVATITPIDDTNATIDVVVMRQHDESDTGYGEHSPSNPKWSIETHFQDEERKLLKEIQYELEKAQREKR